MGLWDKVTSTANDWYQAGTEAAGQVIDKAGEAAGALPEYMDGGGRRGTSAQDQFSERAVPQRTSTTSRQSDESPGNPGGLPTWALVGGGVAAVGLVAYLASR